ncbi:UDP-2,3-diacylglucosamine diphosphatase [Cesiribacter sp. SM1]|uniref:UDP-2,3-diacylglucosamine diphosphatase n=1 Tax=Cesiribacter sp. SM1 TaxID=2861196 RepID=UPI001CD37911|nr:UDP-2,3-diacylglucosamine diphosphatase [Cesiribacter sp. SM1]
MSTQMKREVEVVVISDVHLGTYGCQAKALLRYLKSIRPKTLVLNGDIIDIWQFSKSYWPKAHMQVVKYIMGLISKGVQVHYITGNHDELLRRFTGFKLQNFSISNKAVLKLGNRQAWVFHGDVFDVTMQHSKWLARLGGHGYDGLILLNTFANFCSQKMGRGRLSFSKRIKGSVKSAVKFISGFELTAADIAIEKGYDYVICGHIHQPELRTISNQHGSVLYLNSGDWVESLTALEYQHGQWQLYRFAEDSSMLVPDSEDGDVAEPDQQQLYALLMAEFNPKSA